MNAIVVGVSADPEKVQQRFIDKYGLTFPMISDTERTIMGDYDAKAVLGPVAQRTTYLIDPEGVIVQVWPKVKVEGHAEEVLAALQERSAG